MIKRINVLSRYFLPVLSGMEINIYETYSVLVKRGFNVHIYTTKDTHLEKNILRNYEIINKIKVRRFALRIFPYSLLINSNLYMKDSITVVHDFSILAFTPFFIKTCILKLFKRKAYTVIFSSHGLFSYSSSIYPGIKMKIRKIIERSLCVFLINYCADGIRTVSESEKNKLIEAGINTSRISVITNGIQKEAFYNVDYLASKKIKKIVTENAPYILQVGRIDPVKNYDITIQSLKYISEDVKFLIAGQDHDLNYKRSLVNLVESLGLSGRVKFLGAVYGVNKYYLIKHAECMVHMAKAEAFGNSVHEGMSQGLICIVSKGTGLEYLVKDGINGFCVQNNDQQKLSEKISYTLTNKKSKRIQRMIQQNRKITLGKTWAHVAKKVERYYLNVAYNSL